MITTVVFDIGKVLIGFDWPGYVRSIFDEETARRLTDAMFGSDYWKELDRGVLSEAEILELFYSVSPDLKNEIDEIFRRIGECVSREDWVIDFIESLKDRGLRVLYLSNMSEHVIASKPGAFDFISHMDGGIFSCRVKKIKPDHDIYLELLDSFGLSAEECIFIDDHPDNIASARRLGMKTIRFTQREQMMNDLSQALRKDIGHDSISVLCYGDSNTYGFDPDTGGRYPYEKRWTSILAEKLGSRCEVIAEGLNGRTTAYDRPGAAWKNGARSLLSCLGTSKPVDIVIMMLGTNDCNAALALSSDDIARGMETLVELTEESSPELQGYVPEIVIVAPAAILDDYKASPFAYELTDESVRKSHDIGPLYRDIAGRHGCLFIDASGIDVSAYDCEHLTEKGHDELAELIFAELKSSRYGME